MSKSIQRGDLVCVHFYNAAITLTMDGIVVETPHPPADPHWVIECQVTKAIYYVSEPCTVTKRNPQP